MKLKELVKKLQDKPNQENEVQFLVFETESGNMVCCDISGPSTMEIVKAISKRKGGRALA